MVVVVVVVVAVDILVARNVRKLPAPACARPLACVSCPVFQPPTHAHTHTDICTLHSLHFVRAALSLTLSTSLPLR